MKKILGILCVVAIIFNVYVGMFFELSDNGNDDDDNGNGDPNNPIIPEDFTVTVPARNVGDSAQYDYYLFAEMYWENTTSGEWEKYTLRATGQLVDEISPISSQKDGFNMDHSVMTFHEETAATFTIKTEGSDKEPFTAHGSLDINRHEYTDLNSMKVIQTDTVAHVEVDPLPRIPKPIEYDGSMRNFPDPNEAQEESLDEIIYMGNKKLKLNDNSSILRGIDSEYDWVSEWYSQVYNWSVEGSERVSGYDTLKVNITTGFFQGWLDFTRQVWIANEVSFPVKVYTKTNSSSEEEDGKFYIILEHERVLHENGFIKGSTPTPWGTCGANIHFHSKHPRGEFSDWDYIPQGGSKFEQSSFKYKPEDAEKFALQNSDGLSDFLNQYDDVLVGWASYKEIKDPVDELDTSGRAGKYNWNLSFSYKPTIEEQIEAWQKANDEDDEENREYPNWGYFVNLSYNVTKEPGINKYSETTKIINEGQYNWGDADLSRDQVSDNTLTLAASEEIFKMDPEIKREICGPIGNDINFNDLSYFVAVGDVSPSSMPGMEIIETITGITLPTSRFSWALQKGTVYRAGNTFSSAVDAESGQLLYVLNIEGTDLYGIFD
jgi:hypothetical protein